MLSTTISSSTHYQFCLSLFTVTHMAQSVQRLGHGLTDWDIEVQFLAGTKDRSFLHSVHTSTDGHVIYQMGAGKALSPGGKADGARRCTHTSIYNTSCHINHSLTNLHPRQYSRMPCRSLSARYCLGCYHFCAQTIQTVHYKTVIKELRTFKMWYVVKYAITEITFFSSFNIKTIRIFLTTWLSLRPEFQPRNNAMHTRRDHRYRSVNSLSQAT